MKKTNSMEYEKIDARAIQSDYSQEEILKHFLRLTYNWLMEAELIPIDLRKLSTYQVKKLITNVTANYVVDNKHLFAFYFEKELC